MPAGMYFHSSMSSLPPAWRPKRQCRDTQPIRGAPDERRASSYLERHRAALTDRCQRVRGCVEERQVALAEPSTVVSGAAPEYVWRQVGANADREPNRIVRDSSDHVSSSRTPKRDGGLYGSDAQRGHVILEFFLPFQSEPSPGLEPATGGLQSHADDDVENRGANSKTRPTRCCSRPGCASPARSGANWRNATIATLRLWRASKRVGTTSTAQAQRSASPSGCESCAAQ